MTDKLPYEMKDTSASDVLRDDHAAGWVEGYAYALQDIMRKLTGENSCGKSYDPLWVNRDRGVFSSYAFDMKDGGRGHPIADYKDLGEVSEVLLKEAVGWIREEE